MSWIRVRTPEGHEIDRHESDPGIGDGTFTPIEGYPSSREPRPAKYYTDKDGQPPDLLKGADLDAALEAADLPQSGSADEKRARLIEHQIATEPVEQEIATEVAPAAADPNEE